MTGPGAPTPEPRLPWEAERLRAQLAPWVPGLVVEAVARCASTNTELVERTRSRGTTMAPCLLVADEQTAGRGRLGRAWTSAVGASLTFSLALPLAPRDWSGLSLAVGLALADALEARLDAPNDERAPQGAGPAPRIQLKWPNDLWLSPPACAVQGKLGGILVETVSVGARRWCVVGAGINVRPLPAPLAGGLEARPASLQDLGAELEAPAVLAAVALPLVRAVQAFETEGFAPLVPRFARRDLLRGREVATSGAPQPLRGVAEGVDEQGALLLRSGGALRRIVSGEVSVRLGEAPARAAPSEAG